MSHAPFNFDLNARRNRFGESELIAALRAYAATVHNRPFTMDDFNDWPDRPCNAFTIADRFGSWGDALTRIDIQPTRRSRVTPEELIENLEQVWRDLGRPPGMRTLRRRGRFSRYPYDNHWGSIKRACQALAAFHNGQLSRDALLRGDPIAPRRRALPLDVRWRVMKRDRFRCTACGAHPAANPDVDLEVDHIHPVSLHGNDDDHNLRTLCRGCNLGRRGEGEEGETAKGQ